eukprot:3085174-Amphidinium_carterae.1
MLRMASHYSVWRLTIRFATSKGWGRFHAAKSSACQPVWDANCMPLIPLSISAVISQNGLL